MLCFVTKLEKFGDIELNSSGLCSTRPNVKKRLNCEHSEEARPPHTNIRTEGRALVWGSEFTTKAVKKIELKQIQMAQKPVIRAEVRSVFACVARE